MSKLRPVCFVISPFGEPFDEYYREIYQPAIEAVGLVPLRADEIFRPGVFMQDVFENIDSCTVALADLTDRIQGTGAAHGKEGTRCG